MNTNSNNQNLVQFAQPSILKEIGYTRLVKFLELFSDEFSSELRSLLAALTERRDATIHREVLDAPASSDLIALAAALGQPDLPPDQLRTAMHKIEAAAAPENQMQLDAIIQRRIPCVSVNPSCPLDRALEIWFVAPEELALFNSQDSNEGGLTAAFVPAIPPPSGSPIQIQNSKFKNDEESYAHDLLQSHSVLPEKDVQPWPEPVNGQALLANIATLLKCFVILPAWAAETLALWVLHTYLFKFRDVSTYIGIESPEKRCGKTTLLTILSELVHRPVVSTNISSPAFFRVIEEVQPTLLIDEADTFLKGNHELRGILNSGYRKKTAFVVRVTHEVANSGNGGSSPSTINSQPSTSSPSRLVRFSSWCPKAIATIGRFPDTLADRCIVIRMQRKTSEEQCERLRNLETTDLRQQCARFALDNAAAVAAAKPEFPSSLNDRATDIWEPLLVLADLAGGDWPDLARKAAVALTATAQDSNPIASLLLDIFLISVLSGTDRMFSRGLVEALVARSSGRPWAEARKGKEINELWLAQQLRPYGIRPRTIWIGDAHAKGYYFKDLLEVTQRYVPKVEAQAFLDELKKPKEAKDASGISERERGENSLQTS